MNKPELIDRVAVRFEISRPKAAAVLDYILTTITLELQVDHEINLAGFGKFVMTRRAARKGRNPLTGEPVQIPEKKTVKFKLHKALKEAVNG